MSDELKDQDKKITIADISEQQLFDTAYEAARLANQHQYKGVAKFLHAYEDDFREVHKRLDQIELLLKALIKH